MTNWSVGSKIGVAAESETGHALLPFRITKKKTHQPDGLNPLSVFAQVSLT
jgi:hypothetical protein